MVMAVNRKYNDSDYIGGSQPGLTAPVGFFASPHVVSGPIISITYTLFDPEDDPVRRVQAYYSPNGGGQWLPATLTAETDTTNLAASPWPTGTMQTLYWQADGESGRLE